jgi:hypothetical protein
MLGELELELIGAITDSPLGQRLKTIGSQPAVPDKDLVNRWSLEAPAAYVAAADGQFNQRGMVDAPFVVILVARNAHSQDAARRGDKKVIGLYQMVDTCIALLNERQTASGTWYASAYQFIQLPELRDRGLQVALVAISTQVPAPTPDIADLPDFDLLYAEWRQVPDEDQGGKPLAAAYIHLNPENAP